MSRANTSALVVLAAVVDGLALRDYFDPVAAGGCENDGRNPQSHSGGDWGGTGTSAP